MEDELAWLLFADVEGQAHDNEDEMECLQAFMGAVPEVT